MRAALTALLALAAVAAHADPRSFARTETREPCASYDPQRQPFFGDTHVHTAFSFDAWGQGTLAGPRDAYRFARGEETGMQPYGPDGTPQAHIRLRRALDFAIVTDHSDLLGETQICQDPALPGHDSLVCRVVRRFPKLGYALVNGATYSAEHPKRYSFCGKDGASCRDAGRGPWREIQDAAETYYDRSAACRFTTFVGYEWTGMPAGDNLHRNVIFRNTTAQAYPTTYIETPTPEGLWRALETECLAAGNGCDVLAIPHNSNVSNGRMFTATRSDGAPLTADDARERARLETLAEVTQHKGDSECRAGAEDELCSYEKLVMPRMQDMASASRAQPLPPNIYLREALRLGLELQQKLGVNPFKLGVIGSTDTHLATPGAVDEDEFRGHAAGTVSVRWGVPPYPDRPDFNPGGLAVLWAEENSRDALFEAMRRREAYGTSGPRMTVRFFGGWSYGDDLCARPDFAKRGYAGGVPMGGDLAKAPKTAKSPRFAVWALRDPGASGAPSAPLQRIQIVKGWVAGGESHEHVFEVAGDPNSGTELDLASCTPARGADQLCRVWSDPDFDAAAPAFYYARVVENPSCRWNTWACNAHHVDCSRPESVPSELAACCDASVPKSIQERAWTSPIWYNPD
jgi:Protein of unknown function (DUF3604)